MSKKVLNKRNKLSKEECLFSCKSKIDAYEYKKMVKYFPEIYWSYVLKVSVLNILFYSLFLENLIETLICFSIFEILIMFVFKIRLGNMAERTFNTLNKKNNIDPEIDNEFYEDYFIRKSDSVAYKINYSDIDKFVENNTNFYLRDKRNRFIIILQKNECDLELIEFISNKFNNIKKRLIDKQSYKEIKKYKHPKLIKYALIILFIITIASLVGALYVLSLVNELIPRYGSDFAKNSWVFWCFLPISILSIILGYKFKKAGFKCNKNIIGGYIISFLLLIYGSFSLFPSNFKDYHKIDKYRPIVGVKLPDNGKLEIIKWQSTLEDDKKEHVEMNVYYDKENVSDLVDSIKNSNNWILGKEIKSELKIFLSSGPWLTDNDYFSIYNKTLDEYNTLPNKPGNYEIFAMKYNVRDKLLEIDSFKYNYK